MPLQAAKRASKWGLIAPIPHFCPTPALRRDRTFLGFDKVEVLTELAATKGVWDDPSAHRWFWDVRLASDPLLDTSGQCGRIWSYDDKDDTYKVRTGPAG